MISVKGYFNDPIQYPALHECKKRHISSLMLMKWLSKARQKG